MPPTIILAINAGSSSVKISAYSASLHTDPTLLAEAQVTGLTAPPATLAYTRGAEHIKGREVPGVRTQEDACRLILEQLVADAGLEAVSSNASITHACHRVVHGGDYQDAHVIDRSTYRHLEELTDLAPLHNATALGIVKACGELLPQAREIAHFDSAFHQSIPESVRTYAIDPGVAARNGLRKYGFHGLSYAFVTRAVATFLGKAVDETSVIALHLGSGASACAVRGGRSLDTSMGLTPLEGLPGATRSGTVDPSLIFHFTHDAGRPSRSSTEDLHISTAEEILNKQSGWKALTGTTDFGKIASSSSRECKLAFDLFLDRILGFVGSYYVKLDGQVDALVFAGGIGEKGESLRAAVVERCRCLGFELDGRLNGEAGEGVVRSIGKEGAKHQVLVCRTDEQFEMARACAMDPMLFG